MEIKAAAIVTKHESRIMFEKLRRTINLLVYGGSTSLQVHEELLFKLAEQVLPATEKVVLKHQLVKLERIKRYNDGRMVTFQFDGVKNLNLFPDDSPELCLVSFELGAKSTKRKKKLVGALISHRGKISSLELKIAPKQLKPADWEHLIAKYHGDNPNVADIIDKEEHP